MSDPLTLDEIEAKADAYAANLREPDALRAALRTIARNIADAASPRPPAPPDAGDTLTWIERNEPGGIALVARALAACPLPRSRPPAPDLARIEGMAIYRREDCIPHTASAVPDDDDWQGRACANIEASALATCRQMLAEAERERNLLRTAIGSGQTTEQAVAELAAAVLRDDHGRDDAMKIARWLSELVVHEIVHQAYLLPTHAARARAELRALLAVARAADRLIVRRPGHFIVRDGIQYAKPLRDSLDRLSRLSPSPRRARAAKGART
jgi:hypothetical protein